LTSQTKIKYALLAEWLRSLEAEGYAFGVDKRLQFQELLNKLPEETTLTALKLLLTPLIAQNEQEQNLVYSVFERARKRVEAIHQIKEKTNTLTPPKTMGWLKLLIVLLALLTSLLALLLLNPDVVENEEPHITKFFSSTPSTSDTICLDSSDLAIYEKLSLPIQEITLCQSQNQMDSSIYGSYRIEEDLCLIYTAKDSLGQDSICIQLVDSEQDTFFAYFKPTIEQKNILDTTVVETPLATTISFQAENYPVETDIHSLQIEPLTPFEQFYVNNEWWLRLLFYILSAIITILILLVRERNRRQLVAEIQSSDQAPNIWNVETGETPNIQLEKEYDLLLNNLRQRTTADQRVFDVPKTIQATIDKAGMTNFKYRFRTRPPEYLLLINQRSRDNHRARWYDYLYHYFLENEVLVDRFFYDEDPRLCWNETYVDGLKLKDLQQLHPESRLMFVGTGYSLLNPLTGKSAKWTKVFQLWKERAIFSPTPTANWGRKERLLEQSFVMLPASMQSLQFYVSQLELGSEAEFGNWKNQVEDAHEYGIHLKPEIGNIPMQLTIHYDENVVKWIAACAVYPSLHWDLTMRLGDLLSEPEQSLLTSENISDLNRLPWFVEGEIPPEIRVNLLEWLENSHPETLEKVRFELHDLLQQNPPPKDSIAWEEYHLTTSFNEWLITTDSKRKKQLEEEIARDLAKGTEPDFTVIKYLDRPKTPLDFIIPDAWKKHVYQGGFSGLGFKGLGTDIFWAIPIWLLACFLVWFVEPNISQQCEGEIVDNLLLEVDGRQFIFSNNMEYNGIGGNYDVLPSTNDDSVFIVNTLASNTVLTAKELKSELRSGSAVMTLCIDQPSDQILMGEYYARFGIIAKDYVLTDSITSYVQNVYEVINGEIYPEEKQLADSLFNGYRKNLSVDYWNYAIPLFEEWDSLRKESDDYYQQFQRRGEDSLYQLSNYTDSLAQEIKDSACFFFERSWQLDSLNKDRIDARIWCEERTYNVQIEIVSSSQERVATEIRKAFEENNYKIQTITTDASIRTSEILYFYEEDRAFANGLLIDVKNILVDTDLNLKKETPPFGPGEPRKGEIVIRLADQVVDVPSIPTPKEEPLILLLYAARYNPQQKQAIDQYLESESYILDQSRPFSWIVERSTIFHYSRNGQREANKLADNLEKRFGYEFEVQASDGQLNRTFNSDKTLSVYFIGEEQQQSSRFPILNGIRLNRIARNPNIRVQWLNPTSQRVESSEAQYRIELGVTSNQELAIGNMWIEHNGRVLENREDNFGDQNASKALRYTYDYARTIDLVEGDNILKFLVINEKQEVVEESSSIIINKIAQKNDDLPNNILPRPSIDLYFDNEQPNEKSTASYDDLYQNYLRNRDRYKDANANSPRAVSAQQLEAEVDDFFDRELRNNYNYFVQVLSQIEDYLEQGYELQICLQASVAAGGISNYNNQLVDRRIRSIERSITQYNGGSLATYLRNDALIIQQLPVVGNDEKIAVEETQKQELEEERNYSGRSAYDLFLAQERKVSIISVGRKGSNCTN